MRKQACGRSRRLRASWSNGSFGKERQRSTWTKFGQGLVYAKSLEVLGGDEGTRTRGICRDSLGTSVFSATYILGGGLPVAVRSRKNPFPAGKFVGRNSEVMIARIARFGTPESCACLAPFRAHDEIGGILAKSHLWR